MIDILQRIVELREKKGWTEYQLSVQSGITQSTISSWYRKNMMPSVYSIERLCQAFGITVSQFFAEEDDVFALTFDQKELISEIDKLTFQQKKALIIFIKTLKNN